MWSDSTKIKTIQILCDYNWWSSESWEYLEAKKSALSAHGHNCYVLLGMGKRMRVSKHTTHTHKLQEPEGVQSWGRIPHFSMSLRELSQTYKSY